MKRFPKELAEAVEPAFQAARDVLEDLDSDDVPASLRRVVAHSGPRLTPPLAARLAAEVDALEWLRDDAAERLGNDVPAASRAFLVRGDGWWVEVADAVADVRTRARERKVQSLVQETRKHRESLAAAKAKLKQQKVDAGDRIVSLRDEVKVLRRRADAAGRADAKAHGQFEGRIAELEARLGEARDELVESERVLVGLRQRLRAQRRALASAQKELEAGGSSSVVRDPLALARELDLAAASVPRRHGEATSAEVDASEADDRLVVPAGIRPDRAEVVDWLLEQPGVTVIVDGYNLLFNHEPGEFTTGAARKRLGELMAHFVRKALGDPIVVIVFDSTLPGHRDTRWAGPGVKVTFAQADRLADEEIVLLAGSTAGHVVVVSSDREVQEDAAKSGAVVVWSEAFVEWTKGA